MTIVKILIIDITQRNIVILYYYGYETHKTPRPENDRIISAGALHYRRFD
jgi:hypothetical protein